MDLPWLLLAFGLAALTFAVVLGGREERVFVVVQAASGLAEHRIIHLQQELPRAILLDLLVLAILVPLALRSSRTWPLFVASLCLASLMTEAAQLLVGASFEAYAIVQGIWDLIADLVVAYGAWNGWRARDRTLRTKTPDPG